MAHDGNNSSPVFHFWAEYAKSLPGGDPDSADAPEPMEEYHLDAAGNKRKFRLTAYPRGPLSFLEAREIRPDGASGLRLAQRYNEETELPPYYELREKLAERLATRDLVRDPSTGRLEVLNMKLRAQVGPRGDDGTGPEVVIDDMTLTWEELGEVLATYEGWGLKIQIVDE